MPQSSIVPGAAPSNTSSPAALLHFLLQHLGGAQTQLPPMLSQPPLPPGLPYAAAQKGYPSLYGTDIQDLMSHMGHGENQGPAAEIPYGPLQTLLQHLLPQQFGWLGQTRPLGPGEYVTLPPPHGYASEEDYTIPVDAQGDPIEGKAKPDHWRVIPGLWLVDGTPTHVRESDAARLAKQSGLRWPQFPSEQAANERYVDPRESKWESVPNINTALQPPIWMPPAGPSPPKTYGPGF